MRDRNDEWALEIADVCVTKLYIVTAKRAGLLLVPSYFWLYLQVIVLVNQ